MCGEGCVNHAMSNLESPNLFHRSRFVTKEFQSETGNVLGILGGDCRDTPLTLNPDP